MYFVVRNELDKEAKATRLEYGRIRYGLTDRLPRQSSPRVTDRCWCLTPLDEAAEVVVT